MKGCVFSGGVCVHYRGSVLGGGGSVFSGRVYVEWRGSVFSAGGASVFIRRFNEGSNLLV